MEMEMEMEMETETEMEEEVGVLVEFLVEMEMVVVVIPTRTLSHHTSSQPPPWPRTQLPIFAPTHDTIPYVREQRAEARLCQAVLRLPAEEVFREVEVLELLHILQPC